MQLQNGQRAQEKVTKKRKFSPHALPTSGCSPSRDLGYLLTLAGQYKPLTRLPFLGLPSVIMRHHETAEQDLTEAEILRGSKNTQKNYTKKIFTTQLITMVWSLT